MFKIEITNHLKKQLKRFLKKDKQLKRELKRELKNFSPTHAIPLGHLLYKLRIKKEGAGKSGGYRLIIYCVHIRNYLSPVCMYSKSEQENISDEELADHLERVKQELESLL